MFIVVRNRETQVHKVCRTAGDRGAQVQQGQVDASRGANATTRQRPKPGIHQLPRGSQARAVRWPNSDELHDHILMVFLMQVGTCAEALKGHQEDSRFDNA